MSDPTFLNYGVLALYVGGPAPYSSNFESLTTNTLEGIQSTNIALSFPRIDAFGWDGGGDQTQVERPRAELEMSWLFASGVNERNIGLTVTPNYSLSALSNLNAERNYYLLANLAHQDLVGYSGFNNSVFAFGNGLLSHYGFNAAVGQPTTVNATISALNLLIQPSGTGQVLPAIYKQSGIGVTGRYTLPFAQQTVRNYFETSPNNIVLTFDTGCAIGALLSGNLACPLQSFGFSFDIPRQETKNMGWAYPDTRAAQWPITIGIHAEAMLNGIQNDALNRFNCPDSGFNFGVRFNNACNVDSDAFTFQFNGAKLNSQNFTARVGAYVRVSMDWSLKIYDINRVIGSPNFFINSTGNAYTSVVFPEVEYVSGSAPLTINLGASCYLLIVSGPAFLNGNQVVLDDLPPETVVVRAATTDGSDTKDITLTVS